MSHLLHAWVFLLAPFLACARMTARNLFVADCEGGVHVLAGTPYEMIANLTSGKMLIDYVRAAVYEEAKRACPAMTADDFIEFVMPVS